MNVHERFKGYSKNHCWQYEIRQQNFLLDLQESGMSEKDAQGLCIADFDFAFVPKDDKQGCQEIKEFIERHEWLGKMPNRPTHRFIARLRKNGILAGVVVMSTPNAFSHLLGKENRDKEKLIARGASISWSNWKLLNVDVSGVKSVKILTKRMDTAPYCWPSFGRFTKSDVCTG